MANALFTDLVNRVVTETNRPDLTNTRIPQAIQAATTGIHGIDFFYKDILTADLIFENTPTGIPAYIQEIDTALLQRYRALYELRKWDQSYNQFQLNPTILPPLFNNQFGSPVGSGTALRSLDIITPDDIFDEFNTEKYDVAYQAGSVIMIKSSTALQMCKIHWFARPNTDSGNNYDGYESWIANEYPMAIVYHASAAVFAATGMKDQADSIMRVPNKQVPGDTGGLYHTQIQALLQGNIIVKVT